MDPDNRDDKPKEVERYRAFYREDDQGARVARGWYYHSHLGLQGPFSDQAQAEQDIARLMNTDLFGIKSERENKGREGRRPAGRTGR